jgi:nucleotide-binding universal stress UspA family protein
MMEAESPELFAKLSKTAVQDAISYLEYRHTAFKPHDITVHVRAEMGEPAAKHILDIANKIEADLIVMSTHGRSGLQRWMFGSVAERVTRQATIPILLIRPQETQFPDS